MKYVDPDGREFDEENEATAQQIESNIDSQIAKLQCIKKPSKDIKKRIKELQQSKQDIADMREKEGVFFNFKSSNDKSNPVGVGNPTIDGVGTNQVTMYVDDDMGSKLHESRHGGDVARGKLTKGNYGVSHEISAYRAQYSWSGSFTFRDCPSQEIMMERMADRQPIDKMVISKITSINKQMVKSIIYYKDGTPKQLYPPEGISEKVFYNR